MNQSPSDPRVSKRLALILAAALAAIVIVATIVIVVAVNGATAATQEADYRACMASKNVDYSDPGEAVAAANSCMASVYGE